jgi:hypothetical protein
MHVALRLLREIGEVDPSGTVRLDGYAPEVRDGYIVLPWLPGTGSFRKVAVFARRLHRETACLVADIARRWVADRRWLLAPDGPRADKRRGVRRGGDCLEAGMAGRWARDRPSPLCRGGVPS